MGGVVKHGFPINKHGGVSLHYFKPFSNRTEDGLILQGGVLYQFLSFAKEKVPFNIASEASYVYILPKIVHLSSFGKPEAFGQTVLPDRSILIGQKLMGNAKLEIS